MCLDAPQKYQQGKLQRDLSNRQARLSRIGAKQAIKDGMVQARIARLAGAQTQGQQKAGFAGQGVNVGTGTAAAVQSDTARLVELDALQIQNNAAREAWGLRTQNRFQKYQGDLAYSNGKVAAFTSIGNGILRFYSLGLLGGGGDAPTTPSPSGGASVGSPSYNPKAYSAVDYGPEA
jgi:hypothetical protein